MPGWDSGVNTPSAPSYNSPLIDFSTLGNLAQDYAQGQQNRFAEGQRQRELMLQQPIDAKDPQAVAAELMRRGGAPYAAGLMPFLQSQQPGQVSPLLGGPGGGQGVSAGGGQQQPASLPAPPQASSMASQPAPMAVSPAQQGPGGGYGGGDNGVNTVAAVVGTKLPADSPKTGVIIGNVAKILGVDPNAPMSPEQQQRATRLVDAYAARTASGGEATPVPMGDDVKIPPSAGGGNARVADAFAGLGPQGGQPPAQAAPQPAQGAPQPVQAQPRPQAQPQPQQAKPAPEPEPTPLPPIPGISLPTGFKPGQEAEAVQALRSEEARLSGSPNPANQRLARLAGARADHIEDAMKPRVVAGQVVGPRGEVIYGAQNTLSPDALQAAASGFRQTGKMPPNIGRGLQGNAERVAVQNEAARQEVEAGGDPAEWPQRWQAYGTHAAGLRVLEARAANMTLVESETKTLIPRVREASKKVSRTEYPDLNSIILAAKEKTGNQDVIKFGIAAESLIPVYARLLKPTGQIGVTDTQNARHILNKAWSDGQINAALDQMEVERSAAKDALEDARSSFGLAKPSSGKKTAEPEPAPAAAASPAPVGKPDKDGWVTLPSGVRIREKQ